MLTARKKVELESGRIGLISDTHGLVRPEAVAALKGSDLILHAGDIGKPEVLQALQRIAPVLAIRGNNDRYAWARKIPDCLDLTVSGKKIHMVHDVNDFAGAAASLDAVVSGHSHRPRCVFKDGVLFINPGSAGPRRFKLPVAVGHLQIMDGTVRAKIVELKV